MTMSLFSVNLNVGKSCCNFAEIYDMHTMLWNMGDVSPLPRQPSDIVLASSARGQGLNPQSRTASYQIRYTNRNSSSLV